MDASAIAVLALVTVAVLGCCLAARASRGVRVGDLGRQRELRRTSALEAARRDEEDLQEMLALTNARRRARGLPERSLADAIREFGEE